MNIKIITFETDDGARYFVPQNEKESQCFGETLDMIQQVAAKGHYVRAAIIGIMNEEGGMYGSLIGGGGDILAAIFGTLENWLATHGNKAVEKVFGGDREAVRAMLKEFVDRAMEVMEEAEDSSD